jgi:hypothetical protein
VDGYSYIVQLVDQVSGPAKAARRQVDDLSHSMNAEAKAAKEAEQATAQGAAEMEALASFASMAAAAIAALAVAFGALVIGGAKIALDAALFKARTMAGLKSVTDSAGAARDTFLDIRRISDEIGISEQKAQSLGLSLLDAGVSQAALGDTIKSIATLEKVRGEQAAGKLQELIKKSAASGAFKLEGESLVGTGLAAADVIGELAKKMGKSNAEVEAQIKAGKISAADGIAALNTALTAKLGDPKGLTSFGDAISKVGEMFTRLFEQVDPAPLVGAIREIASWLDTSTPAGQALAFILTNVFQGLFNAAQVVLPYVKIAFLELVIVALKIYIALKPAIKAFDEMAVALGAVGGGGQILRGLIDFWASGLILTAQIITFVVQQFAALVAMATGAWTALKGIFSAEGALGLAQSLIQGLVAGIGGGGGLVSQALVSLGQGAISAVKGVLGIASPSKVMAELGGHTAEGFARGAEDGTARAQGALESVTAPPSAGGGSGGGIQVTIASGAFVVSGGGMSEGALQELVEAKLADFFEMIGMQLGGSTTS